MVVSSIAIELHVWQVAMTMLSRAFKHTLGDACAPTFKFLSQGDKSASCRSALAEVNTFLSHNEESESETCLFGDILDCLPDELHRSIGLPIKDWVRL